MTWTEVALKELVDRWSEGTLPAKEFTHAAHIAVCSYIAWNNTLANTYLLMKSGLYRFNEAVGTPNNEERGYHETLTRFWCTLLFYSIHRGHFKNCALAVDAMVAQYGKDIRAEQAYYSFDVLRSKEARRRWIAPNVCGAVAFEAFGW